MHEIAREWHVDVANFFVSNGGDVNKADFYGRTPLHIAAASDYVDMCDFLLEKGAMIDYLTAHDSRALTEMNIKIPDQKQTPLHFAAASDARASCQVLLEHGADIEARDYRMRTPLFVAAELDRSVSAQYLLDMKADATVKDASGNMVISTMIMKMPEVAMSALDQLSAYNRRHRKQYHYINKIVPSSEEIMHELG